jgi:hypothetical protein
MSSAGPIIPCAALGGKGRNALEWQGKLTREWGRWSMAALESNR